MNTNLKLGKQWPVFCEEQIDITKRILSSGKVNYWTGSEGKTFEKEFSEYLGLDYSIALANGTLALELALLWVSPGDEVIRTYKF